MTSPSRGKLRGNRCNGFWALPAYQGDELDQRHLKEDIDRLGSVLDRTNQRIVIMLVKQV